MIKIMFGAILTICVITYSADIREFTVESGLRDQVVSYLNSW